MNATAPQSQTPPDPFNQPTNTPFVLSGVPAIHDKRHEVGSDNISLVDPNRLYPIGEAAQLLNISIDTLRRWEQKGLITAVRTQGQLRRFSGKELMSYLREAANQDTVISISEAAKELDVSIQTLRRWDKSGHLQAERSADGSRIYRLKAIRALKNPMNQRRQADGSEPQAQVAAAPPQYQPVPTQNANQSLEANHSAVIPDQAAQKSSNPVQPQQNDTPQPNRTEPIPWQETAPKIVDQPKPETQPTQPKPEQPRTSDNQELRNLTGKCQYLERSLNSQQQKYQEVQNKLNELTTHLTTTVASLAQKEPAEAPATSKAVCIDITPLSIPATKAQFDPQGTLVSPQIEDHGENTTGCAVLPAQSNKMVIKTRAVTKNSLIFITPTTITALPLIVPIVISQEGFAVTISQAQTKDISFNWLIIETAPKHN